MTTKGLTKAPKVAMKFYAEHEMADNIEKAYERFKAAGRRVTRNDVMEQLVEDGFRMWRRESDTVNKLEASVARLTEQMSKSDRMLRSILLTLAEGDKEEYRNAIAEIEKMEGENV